MSELSINPRTIVHLLCYNAPMKAEQEQSISLALIKWRPDNIDNTFIKLVVTSIKTGTVEFKWTEHNFHQMLAKLEATGSYETTLKLKETHFDLDDDCESWRH